MGSDMEKEMKLIQKKYDPQKKGLIHYMHFCSDVQLSKKGGNAGVDEIIGEIYKEIRNRHNTFSLFFKNYAVNQTGFL